MYHEHTKRLGRPRCASIPAKDDSSKISALTVDFERCRLVSSSERLSSPPVTRHPFPLKQNSWVLAESDKSESSSSSDQGYQKPSCILPRIHSLEKRCSVGNSFSDMRLTKEKKATNSSGAERSHLKSKPNPSTKPHVTSSPSSTRNAKNLSSTISTRRPSLGVDDSACRSERFVRGTYSCVGESRQSGDGCEDYSLGNCWSVCEDDIFAESDDGDVLLDLNDSDSSDGSERIDHGEQELSEEDGSCSNVEGSHSTEAEVEGRVVARQFFSLAKGVALNSSPVMQRKIGVGLDRRGTQLKPVSKAKSAPNNAKQTSVSSFKRSSEPQLILVLPPTTSNASLYINKEKRKKKKTSQVQGVSVSEMERTMFDSMDSPEWSQEREEGGSPLTDSLFPGRPATLHFPFGDEEYEPLPPEQRALLKWKMTPITPNILKTCIDRVGFTRLKKGSQWMGYWGKHLKSEGFKMVKVYQKINHFPGIWSIGRKDRLWRSLARLQSLYGKKNFDFVPQTFVLPADIRLLRRHWEEGSSKNKWIIKPPASARGIGIRVVHRWAQLPKKKPIVVQRYISNPYLINGNKFDLRVYVYVTSYDPLRIYIYRDGLARFATCKYSSSTKSLSNRFVHLTNYSINKKNTSFEQNPDETVCQGHKWGLLALWDYMQSVLGVDTDKVWESIKDLAIKTIISSEASVVSYMKANVRNKWSCHELLGFDVMLDSTLKPWIIEVNISPSLHSNSQLDVNIKGHMMRDIMNMCQFTLPTRDTFTELCPRPLTSQERAKHAHFVQRSSLPASAQCLDSVLDDLTGDDLRVLMDTEDEYKCCGNFERVFPSHSSQQHLKFFEVQRYYNVLLNAWTIKFSGKHRLKGIALLKSKTKAA